MRGPEVCALLLGLAASAAGAADLDPQDYLSGDWGGLRTRLHDEGVDLQLGYFSEPAFNAAGGERRLARYADQITADASFDLDKLFHWPQAIFKITLTDRNGDNLSADANLHTLNEVQEVYGRGDILRLTELSLEQVLFGGLLDVKLGRLGVGGSFYNWSCQFMNLTFCGELPGNIVSSWYNWPVSQWGARLRLRLNEDMRVEAGLYQINPRNLENSYGTSLAFSGGVGWMIPLEFDWSPLFGPGQRPGMYRVGVWYDTSRQPDVFLAVNGQPQVLNPTLPPLLRDAESGFYLNAQQQLTGTSATSRNLSVFFNWVEADHNTAAVSELLSVGLFYTGPFVARPQDILGFAVGRTRVNPRIAEGQRLLNSTGVSPAVPVQGAEYPIELFYNFNIRRWLSLSPLLQYISHPGGSGAYADVVVLGANIAITF
jgi:porin